MDSTFSTYTPNPYPIMLSRWCSQHRLKPGLSLSSSARSFTVCVAVSSRPSATLLSNPVTLHRKSSAILAFSGTSGQLPAFSGFRSQSRQRAGVPAARVTRASCFGRHPVRSRSRAQSRRSSTHSSSRRCCAGSSRGPICAKPRCDRPEPRRGDPRSQRQVTRILKEIEG